jgi:NADH-quinone oxidoreductase subunit L
MAELLILLVIGLPWIGAVVVLFVDQERLQHQVAAGFSLAAGLVSLLLLTEASSETALTIEMGAFFGEFTFVPDGLAVFLAAIATIVGSLAVIFSIDYMKGEAQLRRYYAFVLFFIGGMAGLVLAGSLLLLFFFWEITALCSYALISFYNDDPKAVAGGIKALIVTQIGGIGLLIGALIVYSYTGSYQIAALIEQAEALPADVLSVLAFGFLIAAAAKSAQVPFHTWLPGAMEAPTPISALIHAATMVNAGVYLLARFYPAFANVEFWTDAVIIVGMLSAVLAACMALVANDLKRVLAYSTISQLGYMVYAVGVGAIYASQFHLLSHSVFKALLFLGAGAVIHAVGTRDMMKMGGLGQKMPFIRNVFLVGALALAGVPILNGFWSKELILEHGLEDGPVLAYGFMLFGAGLTALYTTRMVWMVFYGQPRSDLHAHDATPAMRVSLGALAAGTGLTWLLVGAFGDLLENTLPHHHLHTLALGNLVSDVVAAPATWLALVVVAAGYGLWQIRDRLDGVTQWFAGVGLFAASDFGFEWIKSRITAVTRDTAGVLSKAHTGQLNWNMIGIVGGLVFVLAFLVWGGA